MNENEVRNYWDNPDNVVVHYAESSFHQQLIASEEHRKYFNWLRALGLKETASIVWG